MERVITCAAPEAALSTSKMRTSLTLIALLVSATIGFTQGKLQFANDITRVAYFSMDTGRLVPGDEDVAGYALTPDLIASLHDAPMLTVSLWAGTAASSLSLVTGISTWSLAAGRWASKTVILPAPTFPGGTMAYFQIQIHDSRATSAYDAWRQLGWYAGVSEVFTCVPQISFYSPIYAASAPMFSTWAPGTFTDLGNSTGLGAIEVYTIPEPSIFGLVGLGAGVLAIFRRRR